jgi:flagellar motor switch protein FliM
MTDPAGQLLRFALEGERTRSAVAVFERESSRLAAALRRAVPFLARRGLPVTLLYARAMPASELMETVQVPFHATHLVATPGSARGAVLLDAGAIAMFLDGVLGGNGQSLPTLNPAGLSSPQTALLSGLAANIVRAFSEALWGAIGVKLEPRPASYEQSSADGGPIACVLEFGVEPQLGHAILLLPKEVLLAEPATANAVALDPRIASVLEDVELDLVAELGRLRMTVWDVAALKVGDTLRLDVPVSGTITVRADRRELLRGRPTTMEGHIAVKIAGAGVGAGVGHRDGHEA